MSVFFLDYCFPTTLWVFQKAVKANLVHQLWTYYRYNSSVNICNIMGEIVATLVSDKLSAGLKTYSFDTYVLANGIYLCQISNGTNRAIKKFVVEN